MSKSLNIEDKVFLTRMAEEVIARRLTTPSIFFLEMMKPLNFVSSQAMIFFGPIISENHHSVEFLIQEIERLDRNE